MNKRSFPIITGLSAKSLSSKGRRMMTSQSYKKPVKSKGVMRNLSLSDEQDLNIREPEIVPAELVCPKCNQIALENDKFCAWCGEPFY